MFNGFYKETADFLWGLMFNNERTWFAEHKAEYEKYLNEPFKALAKDVTAQLNAALPRMEWQCHISRIYRDARRLFGRGPYKEKLWFTVYPAAVGNHGPAFWFELGAAQYSYGVGIFETDAAMMERYRRGIDANPARFTRLAEIIEGMDGMNVVGAEYKRPKAVREGIIAKWYNRRWAGAEHTEDFPGEAVSAALADSITEDFLKMMPMFEWFTELYFGTGDFEIED